MTLYGLQVQQRQTLQLALRELEGLRQARIDLNRGFSHLTLSGQPGAPFGQAEGLALLNQAIQSFERSQAHLQSENRPTVDTFRQRVAAFKDSLSRWKQETGDKSRREVALRVAFYQLEAQADQLDTLTQLNLRQLLNQLNRQFAIALAAAALLLALICGVVFRAGRVTNKLALESRESEERFRTIFEKTSAGFSITTIEGNIVILNPALAQMLGYREEELTDSHISSVIHPADFKAGDELRRRVIAGEMDSFQFEIRLLHKEGYYIWAVGTSALLRDEQGQPLYFINNMQDLTERKKAEKELAENRSFLSDLIEHSGAVIYSKDRDGRYLLVNAEWEEVTGLKRHEALGKTDKELFPGATGEEFFDNDRWTMSANDVTELEEMLETEGGKRYFISIKFPIRNDQGEVTGVCGMSTEITERKKAEEALLESENQLRFALEGANDGIWDVNMSTGSTYLSPRSCEILGYPPGELTELPDWSQLVHPDDLAHTRERLQAHLDGRTPLFETEQRLRTKSGSWKWVLARGKLVSRDAEGAPLRMTGTHTDLTEQKRLEAQFLQAQKMEAVGRLAGGIAHDFNNMLLVILGYADIALSQIDDTHPLYRMLWEMRKAGERSADLTQQLLAFARKQTVSPQLLDLNEAVARTLTMLQRLIGEEVTLAWLPKAGGRRVMIDPPQLDQILANLCVNARDAISGIGKITIETDEITLDEAYCSGRPDVTPGDYVILAVSDDGCGMDRETVAKIFEPFFTTKGVGEGTGLGLSTVYGIVKQNSGHISVYSEPGKGTTFRIYLPRHWESGDAVAEAPPSVSMGNGETVLVVEDEPRILEMIKSMLELQGYTPLAASTPEQALDLAGMHPGKIELLLTDVVMPGMNGHDLARRLQEKRPAIKTLFMSGYTSNVIVHHGVLEEGVAFIQKPFTMTGLALKIKAVLNG
ncbi:hybrid sensor histidine kinase/response regulator [Geomonas azotofigens]|uniref:hybrid sensor histidine kinase/response regulator n=1 Tax=Geomonas azotofigens TaxID=2843196 RepID=UPI001C113EFD|nr:PAS domain-containing sensor histidine kinase [Geomonas azotofigens]MBU5613891.1 PAS domain S-box protein [Geomonas azotofigens]